MEQNVLGWSKVTKAIYTSVLLYSIAYLAFALFAGIDSLWSAGSGFVAMANGDFSGGGVNFFTVIKWICLAGVAVGYYLYWKGLGDLSKITSTKDADALQQVRTGALIMIIAAVVNILPFIWGWISTVLYIVAYVMMLMGFSKLKNSETLSDKAKKGMSQLFIASLLLLIAGCITFIFGWIPALGAVFAFLAGLANLVAYIMVIIGWSGIKNSTAPAI